MKKLASLLALLLLFATLVNAQDEMDPEAPMDPEAAEVYRDATKSLKSGAYSEAVKKYNAAIEISPDYRIYYQKAKALLRLRDYPGAVEAFKSCLELYSDYSAAYNGLGLTYYSSGQYEEAVEAFKKFEAMSDKASHKAKAKEYISRAYTKLGNLAKADGNYDRAVDYLNNAVAYHPYDAAYLTLAEIFVETGKHTSALDAADKALNNRDKISRGGPLYYKGKAFKALGENAKAKESFTAGARDPKYKELCEYELERM